MKKPKDTHVILIVDIVNEDALVVPIEEKLIVEAFAIAIIILGMKTLMGMIKW